MEQGGFEYIKTARNYFVPKTPRAALRAVEQGLLPPEAFMYRASSVKPLYEEPFSKDDIDWILARKNIDIETLLLVMQILRKLIMYRDSETALFAAESINQIEKRFTDKVNLLREKLEKKEQAKLRRDLGVNYYQLALVNETRKGIRNFYLREAYGCFRKLTEGNERRITDFIKAVRISMDLKLFGQAEKILEEQREIFGDRAETFMLEAENAFYTKNIFKVMRICKTCNTDILSPEQARIAEFWRGQ